MALFRNLRQRFRYVAFIDVSDSVGLYRRLGDTEAQARIHVALKSAASRVEKSRGRIVKQSGDEILCLFKEPQEAVRALCSVQSGARHVEFRIGMHVGLILLQRQDVFGDVVNMASRLTSIAKARQIILSRDVVDGLPPIDRQLCRWYDELRVRGCESAFAMYQVRWEPELETVANTIPGRNLGKAQAVVLQSGDEIREISADQGLVTIGRGKECTISMNGDRISRLHAKLEFRRGKLIINDSSTNGTYIREKYGIEDAYIRREEMMLLTQGTISLGVPLSEQHPQNTLNYHIR